MRVVSFPFSTFGFLSAVIFFVIDLVGLTSFDDVSESDALMRVTVVSLLVFDGFATSRASPI
jgi:hypothetical protein